MDVKLETPQQLWFLELVSTCGFLNCKDGSVLTRCPYFEFSLSCPLASRSKIVRAPPTACCAKPLLPF